MTSALERGATCLGRYRHPVPQAERQVVAKSRGSGGGIRNPVYQEADVAGRFNAAPVESGITGNKAVAAAG